MSTRKSPARVLVERLNDVRRAVRGIEIAGAEEAAADLPDDVLVAAGDLVVELRRRLGLIESALLWQAGRNLGRHQGSLPDGRLYELYRGRDRKEWDHDGWKHDVRRVITTKILEDLPGESLFTVEGEEVNLAHIVQEALAAAQDVHGSTDPKSTVLMRLGLSAGDYSTSSPSGWRLKVTPRKRPAGSKALRADLPA